MVNYNVGGFTDAMTQTVQHIKKLGNTPGSSSGTLTRRALTEGVDFTQGEAELSIPFDIPEMQCQAQNVSYTGLGVNMAAGNTGSAEDLSVWFSTDPGYVDIGGMDYNGHSLRQLKEGTFEIQFDGSWYPAASVAPAAVQVSGSDAFDVVANITTPNGSAVTVSFAGLHIRQQHLRGSGEINVISAAGNDAGTFKSVESIRFTLSENVFNKVIATGLEIAFSRPLSATDSFRMFLSLNGYRGDGYGNWDPAPVPLSAETFDFRAMNSRQILVYWIDSDDLLAAENQFNIAACIIRVIDSARLQFLMIVDNWAFKLGNATATNLERTEAS